MDKIKKRLLDDELINEIESSIHKGEISWDDFGTDLKKQLLNSTSAGTGSESQNKLLMDAIDNINALKQTKVDLNALNEYIKKGEPNSVTTNMLDATMKSELQKLDQVITNVNRAIGDYIDTNKISWSQLNGETQNRITSPDSKLEEYRSAISKLQQDIATVKKSLSISDDNQTLATRVDNLETKTTDLQSKINELSANLSVTTSKTTNNTNALSELDERVTTSITSLSSTVSKPIDASRLEASLNDKINEISKVDSKISAAIESASKHPGTPGQLFVANGANGLVPVALMRTGTIARTSDELAAARTANKPEILFITDGTNDQVLLSLTYAPDPAMETMIDSLFADNNVTYQKVDGTTITVTTEAERSALESAAAQQTDSTKVRFIVIPHVINNYLYAYKMFYDSTTHEVVLHNGSQWITIMKPTA